MTVRDAAAAAAAADVETIVWAVVLIFGTLAIIQVWNVIEENWR